MANATVHPKRDLSRCAFHRYYKLQHEDCDTEDDNWWDMDILPRRFHWLVDEWNNGNIKRYYPHWWEEVDTRKEHINNLLQLSHEELHEVMNYVADVFPHKEWKIDTIKEEN
jgi:hypothetical protein